MEGGEEAEVDRLHIEKVAVLNFNFCIQKQQNGPRFY